MVHVVVVVIENNAPTIIVEGTKNEELVNVHVTTTRMKPIDLDKSFEGGTLPIVNKHKFVTNHGYLMHTSRTKLSIYFSRMPYCNSFLFL